MEILNGIDMEKVSRFESLVNKESFMNGVFTKEEQDYIMSCSVPAKAAASGFSAKEAVSKSLGRGLYGMLPKEIQILREESGRPCVVLSGSALLFYGCYSFSVSISYKDDYVVTSCVAYNLKD